MFITACLKKYSTKELLNMLLTPLNDLNMIVPMQRLILKMITFPDLG